MAIYLFNGDDWEMLVEAPTLGKARKIVVQELKDQNCAALIPEELKAKRLRGGDGIIHSTLESRCEKG